MTEPWAPETAGQHAERQLLDALDRVLRQDSRDRDAAAGAASGVAQGLTMMAVHLSRLTPTGPRAHHRRVAAVLLDDVAGREAGQLFGLTNGDMVLLFRPADGGAAVTEAVGRLFGSDLADPAALSSVWALPDMAVAALTYVRDRALEGERAAPAPEPESSAAAIAAMQEVVRSAPLAELTRRQTAVLLHPARHPAITPLFREVAISVAVLEGRGAGVSLAGADPFLFNHLAARLDRRMLAAMRDDIPAGGPLSGGLGRAGLHLNLTVAGVLSQGFAALMEAAAPAVANGLRLGIELPFAEIFADAQAFVLARERLRLAGCDLVLDGLTHQALALTSLAALRPNLVKLSWSGAMPGAGPAVTKALRRLGPDRVVLARTETEAAVAWGLQNGISRFQGHYVDFMLAAERLKACPGAPRCTLRLCADRAAQAGTDAAPGDGAGRAGCTNPGLLASALPGQALPGHAPPGRELAAA